MLLRLLCLPRAAAATPTAVEGCGPRVRVRCAMGGWLQQPAYDRSDACLRVRASAVYDVDSKAF